MRYLWILFLVPLLGMTQINNNYKDEEATFIDFKNIYDNAQDQSFDLYSSTPAYQSLRDRSISFYMSFSTGSDLQLIIRVGTNTYSSPTFSVIKAR